MNPSFGSKNESDLCQALVKVLGFYLHYGTIKSTIKIKNRPGKIVSGETLLMESLMIGFRLKSKQHITFQL